VTAARSHRHDRQQDDETGGEPSRFESSFHPQRG
jgi:hypothetical protein